MKKLNQNGFGLVEGLLIFVAVLALGLGGYYVLIQNKDKDADDAAQSEVVTVDENDQDTSEAESAEEQPVESEEVAEAKQPYLEFPKFGVRFKLSSELSDAYITKSPYISIKRLDSIADCYDIAAIGVVNKNAKNPLASTPEKPVLYRDTFEGVMIGDTFYYLTVGNAPCTLDASKELKDIEWSARQAFIKAAKTLEAY